MNTPEELKRSIFNHGMSNPNDLVDRSSPLSNLDLGAVMTEDKALSNLNQLTAERDSGVISDEEYNRQADHSMNLLAQDNPSKYKMNQTSTAVDAKLANVQTKAVEKVNKLGLDYFDLDVPTGLSHEETMQRERSFLDNRRQMEALTGIPRENFTPQSLQEEMFNQTLDRYSLEGAGGTSVDDIGKVDTTFGSAYFKDMLKGTVDEAGKRKELQEALGTGVEDFQTDPLKGQGVITPILGLIDSAVGSDLRKSWMNVGVGFDRTFADVFFEQIPEGVKNIATGTADILISNPVNIIAENIFGKDLDISSRKTVDNLINKFNEGVLVPTGLMTEEGNWKSRLELEKQYDTTYDEKLENEIAAGVEKADGVLDLFGVYAEAFIENPATALRLMIQNSPYMVAVSNPITGFALLEGFAQENIRKAEEIYIEEYGRKASGKDKAFLDSFAYASAATELLGDKILANTIVNKGIASLGQSAVARVMNLPLNTAIVAGGEFIAGGGGDFLLQTAGKQRQLTQDEVNQSITAGITEAVAATPAAATALPKSLGGTVDLAVGTAKAAYAAVPDSVKENVSKATQKASSYFSKDERTELVKFVSNEEAQYTTTRADGSSLNIDADYNPDSGVQATIEAIGKVAAKVLDPETVEAGLLEVAVLEEDLDIHLSNLAKQKQVLEQKLESNPDSNIAALVSKAEGVLTNVGNRVAATKEAIAGITLEALSDIDTETMNPSLLARKQALESSLKGSIPYMNQEQLTQVESMEGVSQNAEVQNAILQRKDSLDLISRVNSHIEASKALKMKQQTTTGKSATDVASDYLEGDASNNRLGIKQYLTLAAEFASKGNAKSLETLVTSLDRWINRETTKYLNEAKTEGFKKVLANEISFLEETRDIMTSLMEAQGITAPEAPNTLTEATSVPTEQSVATTVQEAPSEAVPEHLTLDLEVPETQTATESKGEADAKKESTPEPKKETKTEEKKPKAKVVVEPEPTIEGYKLTDKGLSAELLINDYEVEGKDLINTLDANLKDPSKKVATQTFITNNIEGIKALREHINNEKYKGTGAPIVTKVTNTISATFTKWKDIVSGQVSLAFFTLRDKNIASIKSAVLSMVIKDGALESNEYIWDNLDEFKTYVSPKYNATLHGTKESFDVAIESIFNIVNDFINTMELDIESNTLIQNKEAPANLKALEGTIPADIYNKLLTVYNTKDTSKNGFADGLINRLTKEGNLAEGQLASLNKMFASRQTKINSFETSPLAMLMVNDEQGNKYIPRNIKALVAISSMQWLYDYDHKNLIRSKESVAELLGADPLAISSVPDVIYNRYSKVGGTERYYANSLGKDILKGIKLNLDPSKTPETLKQSLTTALGLYGLAYLEKKEYTKRTGVPITQFNKDASQVSNNVTEDIRNPKAKINFINLAIEDSKESPLVTQAYSFITNSRDIGSIFGVERHKTFPSTKKPKNSTNRENRKSKSSIPEVLYRRIDNYANTPFSFNEKLMALVLSENGVQKALELLGMGNIEATLAKAHYTKRDGIEANYNDTVRALEYLVELYNENGNAPMYFTHELKVQLRNHIKTSTVNPQTNKVQRLLFQPMATMVKVTRELLDSDNNQDRYLTLLAVGLGFDEKSNPKDRDVLVNGAMQYYRKAVQNEGINVILDSPLNTWSAEQLSEINSHLTDMKLSGLDGLNTLIEIHNYQKLLDNPNHTYTTNLVAEVDGVTNGFALSIMQAPLLANIHSWLHRVGIYADGSYRTFNAFITDGSNTDSYQSIARPLTNIISDESQKAVKDFVEYIFGPLTKVGEDNQITVTSAARNIIKSPFMIFNYGAGKTKLLLDVMQGVESAFYSKVESIEDLKSEYASKDTPPARRKELSDILKAERVKFGKLTGVDIRTTNLLQHDFTSIINGFTRKKVKADKTDEGGLAYRFAKITSEVINNEIGALDTVKETINNAYLSQFLMFEMHYLNLKDKYTENGTKTLTIEMAEAIIKEVESLIPRYYAPSVFERGERKGKDTDYVAVLKLEAVSGKDSATIQVTSPISDGRMSSTTPITVEQFLDGGVSGLVMNIHSMDADIISKVKEQVLLVHDAVKAGFLNFEDASKQLNEATADLIENYHLSHAALLAHSNVLESFSALYVNNLDKAMSWVNSRLHAKKMSMIPEFLRDSDEVVIPDVDGITQDLINLFHETYMTKKELFHEKEVVVDQYPSPMGNGAITRSMSIPELGVPNFLKGRYDTDAPITTVTEPVKASESVVTKTKATVRKGSVRVEEARENINKALEVTDIDAALQDMLNGIVIGGGLGVNADGTRNSSVNISEIQNLVKGYTGIRGGTAKPTLREISNTIEMLLEDPSKVLGMKGNPLLLAEAVIQIAEGLVEKNRQETDIDPDLLRYSAPFEIKEEVTLDSSLVLTPENLVESFEEVRATDNIKLDTEVKEVHDSIIGLILSAGLERIGDVIVNLNTALTEQYGSVQDNIVNMTRAETPKGAFTQSQQEIFIHELLHIVSSQGITDPRLRADLIKLLEFVQKNTDYTVFLDKDQNGNIVYHTDKDAEIAAAKALYDYAVAGITNATDTTEQAKGRVDSLLSEFVSFGLSNPNMVKHLIALDIKLKATDKFDLLKNIKGDSLIGKFINALYRLVEMVFAKASKAPKGSTAYAQLNDIVMQMQSLQNNVKKDPYEATIGAATDAINVRVSEGLDSVIEKAKATKDAITKRLDKQSEAIDNIDPNSELGQSLIKKAQVATGYFLKLQGIKQEIIDSRIEAIDSVAKAKRVLKQRSALHLDSEGLPANVINTLMGSSSLSAGWHKLINAFKGSVDRKREVTRRTTREYVNKLLPKMNQAESKAVTINVLATDLITLVDRYGIDTVRDMINDQSKVNERISELKARIKANVSDPKIAEAMLQQADGLGHVMVKGEAYLPNQQSNASAIANGFMLKNYRNNFDKRVNKVTKDKEALIADIDALASLAAIRYIPYESKATFKKVWDNNQEGISELLDIHRGYKQKSKEHLFNGSENLMRKGFYSTVYDNNIETIEANMSQRKELENQGYKLVNTVESKEFGGMQIGFFQRRKMANSEMVNGVFSLQSMQSKGTTLTSQYKLSGMVFDGAALTEYKSKENNKYTDMASKGIKGKNFPMPIINNEGFATDYRYMMNETQQSTVMNKDYDIANVMGAMQAALVSKVQAKEANQRAIDFAIADFNENYVDEPDSFVWVNGNEVTSDGSINKHYEAFRMLPKEVRDTIKSEWGDKGIPLRKGMVRMILGGSKYSIAESKMIRIFQERFPNLPIKKVIGFTEALWQEIVTTAKVGIVIKTPAVFGFNIMSNILLGAARGIPPHKLFSDYIEAIRFLRDFETLEKERIILEEKLIGKENKEMRQRLNIVISKMEDSPINEMIKRGLFQQIAEDVDTSTHGYLDLATGSISDKAEGLVGGKTVAGAKWVGSQIFMTSNSAIFKAFNKATTYSDFVARYALIKNELKKNATKPKDKKLTLDEIYQDAVDAHINYDLRDHMGLEYANSMGALMFTKFFLGIQHVIVKTSKNNAANTALVLSTQALTSDLADIFDENLISKDFGATKIYLDPTYHLEAATTPYGWDLLMDLLSIMFKD